MAPYVKAHQVPPSDYHPPFPTPAPTKPLSISKRHIPRGGMHPIVSAPPSSFSVMRYVWGDFYINQSPAKRASITLLSVLLIIIFIFSFILLSCAFVAGWKAFVRKYKTSNYHKNRREGEKWVMYHGMRGHYQRGYFETVQRYGGRTEKESLEMKDLERGEGEADGEGGKKGKGKWWKRKGKGTQVNVTEVDNEGVLGREITEAELADEEALANIPFWKRIFGAEKKVADDKAPDAAVAEISVGAADDEEGGTRDDTRGTRMGVGERGGALEIQDLERGGGGKGKGKWWKRKGTGTPTHVKVTEVGGGGILGREITEAELADEQAKRKPRKLRWYKRGLGAEKKADNTRDAAAPKISIDGAERGYAREDNRGRRMGLRDLGIRFVREGAVIRGRSLVRSLESSSGSGQVDGANSERTRASTSGELSVPPAEADTESESSGELAPPGVLLMPPIARVNSRTNVPEVWATYSRGTQFITLSEVERMRRAIRDRANLNNVPVVRERSTRDPNFISLSDAESYESARRARRTNLDTIIEDQSTQISILSSIFSGRARRERGANGGRGSRGNHVAASGGVGGRKS